MITRLKVNGFKNLVNVDVHFGAFTCIAGANGVGKSNLFDAIRFLSALADQKLVVAAQKVRDGDVGDVRSLFHQGADGHVNTMRFEVEMIVPLTGEDDLGQEAHASITFLRYVLEIGYTKQDRRGTQAGLEVLYEELSHINRGDAKKHLPFSPTKEWIETAIQGKQGSPLISVDTVDGTRRIYLHINRTPAPDKGKTAGGKPYSYIAANLPKTVLSEVSSTEHRTALMARREMQSWQLLQLEPSALRSPSRLLDTPHLSANGEFLPATLYRLEQESIQNGLEPQRVYDEVTNRLAKLIGDVSMVEIDRDEGWDRMTLRMRDKNGVSHAARFLSDGTLRFLALATLERDTQTRGVICLEEPENGIHPSRIPAILHLLTDIATDTQIAIAPQVEDNPLRQVIINTHSPLVVQQVDEGDLVVATPVHAPDGSTHVQFRGLNQTWRADVAASESNRTATLGELLGYLGTSASDSPTEVLIDKRDDTPATRVTKRVRDRDDVKQYHRSLFEGIEE